MVARPVARAQLCGCQGTPSLFICVATVFWTVARMLLCMRRLTGQKRSERRERPSVTESARERDSARERPSVTESARERDSARERPKLRARETECDRECEGEGQCARETETARERDRV